MGVPLLDLRLQYSSIRDEVLRSIEAICETQQFVLGESVESFEQEIAEYCGVPFAIGMSSGTDALLCSLMAAGVGAGDEVITSPYTFFGTAGCIARVGARPVFVDIDPETFNIDPDLIGPAITEKTRAIIPVHLFGQCAEMDPIVELAERRGLVVIEDAAQSLGAQYKGQFAGTMGRMGCFSFFPSKNLGAFGDAGMVVTSDRVLSEKLKMLRMHGEGDKYYHRLIGGNFRLDALQAAILRVKLKYLDRWHEQRRLNASKYDRLFEGTEVICPKIADYNVSVFNLYCIQVPDRKRVVDHLRSKDIGYGIYYPVPLHLQECFSYLGYRRGAFPRSEHLADRALAIPVYPELTDEQIELVAETVLDALK